MPTTNELLYAFNRGIVSKRALARIDQERLRLSAETVDNWIPRSVGSMSIRPGTEKITNTYANATGIGIPFIYSNSDTAFIELTDGYMRPIVNGSSITRNTVSSSVTNGDFSAGGSWTIATTGGGSGTISGGKLTFSCVPIKSSATCTQSVTIGAGDLNDEHGLTIVVDRGPVIFRAGTTSGGTDIFNSTVLGTGTHSLALTPTASPLYLQLESRVARNVIVDSIQFESGTEVKIASPWSESELDDVRWVQSADIVFVDCTDNRPRQIERRTTRSWSLVEYDHTDGPFEAIYSNSINAKLSIAAAMGNSTITSTKALFKSTDVGLLVRFFSPGYNFSYDMAQADISTPAVRINGVGTARRLDYTIAGTFTATLTLQKSFIGPDSGFVDVATHTTTATSSNTDTADNTAVWYRFTIKSGNYTSGTATVTMTFGVGGGEGGFGTSQQTSVGGAYGIARITSFTSSTSVDAEILTPFTSNISTDIFQFGVWSPAKGYPSAPAFHEGRLFHGGVEKIIGSVSDSYVSFDPGYSGDAGPISRSIGYGPVQNINFLLPLTRLVIGGDSSEIAVRSSTFDEPLTPVNFALKDISTNGSARIPAHKIDTRGVFVDKSGTKLIELAYNVQIQDFGATNLAQLVPDLNVGNPIKRIFVQRNPDTRIHCIREDGTVAILLSEPAEQVSCWITYTLDGVVEDGFCLPSEDEDEVYYLVRRTINGSTVRFWERFAKEYECVGGTTSKNIDCHTVYSGASTATMTGLSYLNGETVCVWGAGKDLGTYTVSGGSITLSQAVTSAVIGLPYDAVFKSAKLAYAAAKGTPLSQVKRVTRISLLLYKTHYQGLRHGRDANNLTNLPLVISGKEVAADTIHEDLDIVPGDHKGDWSPDTRIYLKASSPRPATVLAAVFQITTNDT